MEKRIISAAITGSIHTPTMSQHLPITPKQIADEAVRSWEAGAAVAHIHVRNPETGQPTSSLDLFRELISEIKGRCDLVLCFSTGGGLGMTVEERAATVPEFKPELASCNFGSLNFGLFHVLNKLKDFEYDWEQKYLSMTEDFIFPNTFKTLREFITLFEKHGTKPELEIYDTGMINNAAFLTQQGHLRKPLYLQFVMGILGGIPAGMENLMFMVQNAKESIGDFQWSVCAAGRFQMNMCTTALLMGGHARVGLEDSLYLERGRMAESNAQQVEKIVRIGRELGIEPASPDEAREILELKGLENVAY